MDAQVGLIRKGKNLIRVEPVNKLVPATWRKGRQVRALCDA